MRDETDYQNALIDEGVYAAALNQFQTLGPPPRREPVPHINFAPLKNALAHLQAAATAFDEAAGNTDRSSAEINRLLFTSERLLSREEGLEGRNWYKHHIYAPGFYTGYGVKTIPGVREAIEQRDYEKVAPQIDIAADVIGSMARRIEAITAELEGD